MHTSAIASARLLAQHLAGAPCATPADVVYTLGGVQAQDLASAYWSIGLRLQQATEAAVERAVVSREIVRTWSLRGTLHFVAAADVRWLTALVGPTIVRKKLHRYGQLGLDETTFARSARTLQRVLAGGAQCTRAEIAGALEADGVSAEGRRTYYLLHRAGLEGLICFGPPRDREPTHVLVADWVAPAPVLDCDEALRTLAARYFSGHGAATLRDFAWWSGLPLGEVRQALEAVESWLEALEVEGAQLWRARDRPKGELAPRAHLLPSFDEFLLGYRDRAAVVDSAHVKTINAGGGMPRRTVLLDGRVSGVWWREVRKGTIRVTAELFRPLAVDEMDALRKATDRYGAFRGLPVELVVEA